MSIAAKVVIGLLSRTFLYFVINSKEGVIGPAVNVRVTLLGLPAECQEHGVSDDFPVSIPTLF